MNNIEKRVLQGELKYKDTVVLTYRIEYPELVNYRCNFGVNKFNQYNKNIALNLQNRIYNELFKQASEVYDYNTANGYPVMIFEVILEYNITYFQNSIISLYYNQYEFTGGAHGSTIRTSQTWDLCKSKMLDLSHFYPDNPYFIIEILKNINTQISNTENPGQYFENYCELVLDTFNLENYYLTDKGIVIYFQQYDIAPYSSGIPEFLINKF